MRLKKETDYSIWIIYLVISLFILGIDSLGWFSGIKSLGEKITNPVSGVVRSTSQNLLKPISMIKFISSGPQRILDLESRYAEAIVTLEELESVKEENTSLKKLLGNNPEENFSYYPVSIVGGSKEIILSKGKSSKIEAGDTVISPSNTLVGRVARVSTYTSWVTTPQYYLNKIPVIIGLNRIPGVLIGTGESAYIDLEQSEKIFVGDLIFTSGINGDYVPNILIGKVNFVEEESANIYKNIQVDIFSNPDNTVLVVKAIL
jgi:rod shape-determining protein MreC